MNYRSVNIIDLQLMIKDKRTDMSVVVQDMCLNRLVYPGLLILG